MPPPSTATRLPLPPARATRVRPSASGATVPAMAAAVAPLSSVRLVSSAIPTRVPRRVRPMRRLLPTAAVLTALALPAAADASVAGAARAIDRARQQDPAQLRTLLWAIPKGADLHMHLSGS